MRKWKWPLFLVAGALAIIAVAHEQHYAREKYEAQKQADCIDLSVSPAEDHSCAKEAQNRKDYAPWWDVLLAWPEGITTWAIILTFAVIGWQTDETRKAARAAEKQADLTKKQSDLMVEKERAKLRIELHEFRLSKDKHDVYNVKGAVSIYGSTEAFIERTEIYASVGWRGILNPLPEWLFGMHLPPVIRAAEQPIEFKAIVMAEDGPAGDEHFLLVRETEEFIYCIGKIEFADAFGQKWVYRLQQRFGFFWSETASPGIGGKWDLHGQKTDNGEYRADAEQRPKPN